MYLKCIELDSNNLTALLGLFQTCSDTGSASKVGRYLEIYLNRYPQRMHPGDTEVMYCLATLYVKDGRLGEAKKILSEILALKPTYTDAANLLEEVEKKPALEEGEKSPKE